MKKNLVLFSFLFSFSIAFAQPDANADAYYFKVNIHKVIDDKLEIELTVPETVRQEKTVNYHIPKIVPGTYSIYNFGRFVTNFKAYAKNGKPFKGSYIKQIDDNTWEISKAKKLYKITYTVEDTWDTEKDPKNSDDFIFEPGGTNIEADKNFVLNNHGFFGYFAGFKRRSYYLEIDRPTKFFGATSLLRVGGDEDTDLFNAPNYMDLADAPIMYSEPDTAIIKVGNANVLIANYSPNGLLDAKFIAGEVEPILQAQKAYLGGTLPVDRYAFIIYLSDQPSYSGKFGALEHSYSSFYYLPEMEAEQIAQSVRDVAAHEFFHIVTPLTIHSEEIQNFDYINPKMSQHLWLYEGVTEYSAGHVQVSQGLMPIESYLRVLEGKVRNAAAYKDNLPFTVMSSQVLTKHKDQYGNVYEKGALIGLCLDIKIRQLSNGQKGLQSLMRDLSKTFGKDNAFKDDELFQAISNLTNPEIGNFLNRYVAGTESLPLTEILAETGIQYFPKKMVKDISPFGGDINQYIGFEYSKFKFKIANEAALDAFGKDFIGFKKDDLILQWNGQEVTPDNINNILGTYYGTVKEGSDLSIVVERNGERVELKTQIIAIDVEKEHVFELIEAASDAQIALRRAWLGDYKTKADFENSDEGK